MKDVIRVRTRGVATMLVVIMLMLVATTVVAMGLVFTSEARRTQAATAGAQLRQLLLAAPAVAEAELRSGGTDARTVSVETPVAGATLVLTISGVENRLMVRATARLNQYTGVQMLTYGRTGDPARPLTLQEARLVESP